MRRRGMTLIELLVAITLGAIITGLFAQVMVATLRGRERLQERGPRITSLRRAYDVVTRDLHSMTLPPDDSGMEFGNGGLSSGIGGDVLQFAAVVGEPLLALRQANETVLIQYVLDEDPDTERPVLWRYETPYPLPEGATSPTEETRILPLLRDVQGVTYLFYSSTQQTWLETWDGQPGLPTAIRMDLALADGSERSEPKLISWVLSVPAGAYASDQAEQSTAEFDGATF